MTAKSQADILVEASLAVAKRRVRKGTLQPCWCECPGTECVGQPQCHQAAAALATQREPRHVFIAFDNENHCLGAFDAYPPAAELFARAEAAKGFIAKFYGDTDNNCNIVFRQEENKVIGHINKVRLHDGP